MPKLEPKLIQKELEAGVVWPFYWIYGSERMKSRELLKRIRRAVLGEGETPSLNEETLDGSTVSGVEIRDSAMSLSLAGGTRFIVVRDAHAVSEPEALSDLMGAKGKPSELPSVCVFLSKDLDMRRKFSKSLVEKAAVVPCEEIAEHEREAWIQYLAKRRNLVLDRLGGPAVLARLVALDPWGLDIVDSELEKMELAGPGDEGSQETGSARATTDQFLEAFFKRELRSSLLAAEGFAEKPDESLPTLGLLAWNARQLGLVVADRTRGTRHAKLNPYVAEKLTRWSRHWSPADVATLNEELAHVDFGLKQTPLLPLGLWSGLIQRFCS